MERTIVLAEDSRTIRRMVEIALDRHPFSLTVAEDGEAALEAVRSRQPAVVLVDTALPGIDGYELAARIKGDPATSGVRVLLLAGQNQRLDEARARQSGADGHITKPFLTQDLLDAIYKVTTGELAPDGELFRQQAMKVPLARKSGPPKPPPAPAARPAAPPSPPPAPAAPPPAAQAAGGNPFEGVSNPFDANENTRPFLRRTPPPAARSGFDDEPTQARGGPPEPAVAAAAQAVTEAVVSDEAIRKALSGVSREVIERIVWEVVPPLAEAILKEGIARVVRERLAASSAN